MGAVEQEEVEGSRGRLRGIIHRPNATPIGFTLILHGSFSSDKVGPARLYVQIARLLSDAGYTVGRFDCYGVGDSDGDLEDVSLASEFEDYRIILRELASDAPEVCLFSHSGSAQLAISLAHDRPDPTSLILLTPTVGRTVRYDRLFTDEQRRLLAEGRSITRQGIPISAEFMTALHDETVFRRAQELGMRQLPPRAAVLYSEVDEYVTRDGALCLAEALGICPTPIPGADHNFRILEARELLFAELRRLLSRWSPHWATPASTIA